jgi:hypothetical protein
MDKGLKAALVELKECLEAGVISQDEFERSKVEILRNFVSRPVLSPIQFADEEESIPAETHSTPLQSEKRSGRRVKKQGNMDVDEAETVGEAMENVQEFSRFLEEEVATTAKIMVSPSKAAVSEDRKAEKKLNSSITEQHQTDGGMVNVITTAESTNHQRTEEESFSITDTTVEQFWSLILQTPIPEGNFSQAGRCSRTDENAFSSCQDVRGQLDS